MSKRPVVFAIFLASLTLAPLSLFGQPAPKRTKPSQPVTEEQLQRAEEDPRLANERDRFDTQMNRELLQMRRDVMQDSINRMNQARFGGRGANVERILSDCLAFSVFVIILCSLLWLVRTILENRRWNRIAQIQTDVHGKLLEKMASNQELLAYMETEAGKRFLESSPFEIEHRSRPSLPLGRILLPAQAGVVILMAGCALVWLQDRLPDDAQGLLLFGILGMALGIGLIFSAGLAYTLSKNLGLTGNAGNNQ
jgi:hypothetical protein